MESDQGMWVCGCFPELRRESAGGWVALASEDQVLLRPLVASARRSSCVTKNIVVMEGARL